MNPRSLNPSLLNSCFTAGKVAPEQAARAVALANVSEISSERGARQVIGFSKPFILVVSRSNYVLQTEFSINYFSHDLPTRSLKHFDKSYIKSYALEYFRI